MADLPFGARLTKAADKKGTVPAIGLGPFRRFQKGLPGVRVVGSRPVPFEAAPRDE
jgi:hypothetical protein